MIELLYKHPDMEKVEIRQDIIYKKSDGNLLKMDVYYSRNSKLINRPTVILVHGSDAFNEGEETNSIIEQTIKFIGK